MAATKELNIYGFETLDKEEMMSINGGFQVYIIDEVLIRVTGNDLQGWVGYWYDIVYEAEYYIATLEFEYAYY